MMTEAPITAEGRKRHARAALADSISPRLL